MDSFESEFDLFVHSLPSSSASTVSQFFSEINSHIFMTPSEKAALRTDFEKAILYYASQAIPLKKAFELLDARNLGGFYSRPPILWFALDDAAKIYPLSMKHGQMAVFRLSIYLKEAVVPEILQMALTFTIKRFPSFATTVKKGFFWHYLDSSKRRYTIEQESDAPCSPLEISKSGSQSFRVLYYNNRISAEYFHVLTDGTGGMVFLKTLVCEYLRLLGKSAICYNEEYGVLNINEAAPRQDTANEFARNENTDSAIRHGFVDSKALQLSGKLSAQKPCRVLSFRLDANQLKNTAARYGVSVTAYMLALIFLASKSAIDETAGDVNIQVPVNMRKFYSSSTVRNFALYCGIRLSIKELTDVQSIADKVSTQLAKKASKEAMSEMMHTTSSLVHLLRYIPLIIKSPVAGIAYGFLGDKIFTNTLSNLGVISLPSEMNEHILGMDFVLGTAITNRASCALVTFGNVATLSITKNTFDPSFEEALEQLFYADGICISIEGSEVYEG